MLQSNCFVLLCGLVTGVGSWYFSIRPSSNALMILGVMFSIFFGFYITQLTVLIGSSASRFLYEKINTKDQDRELNRFIASYQVCTHLCLTTIALLFIYLVFEQTILSVSLELTEILVSAVVCLSTMSLMKVKQMFDVMIALLKQEAPFASRATLNDIENVRKSEIQKMMQEKQ